MLTYYSSFYNCYIIIMAFNYLFFLWSCFFVFHLMKYTLFKILINLGHSFPREATRNAKFRCATGFSLSKWWNWKEISVVFWQVFTPEHRAKICGKSYSIRRWNKSWRKRDSRSLEGYMILFAGDKRRYVQVPYGGLARANMFLVWFEVCTIFNLLKVSSRVRLMHLSSLAISVINLNLNQSFHYFIVIKLNFFFIAPRLRRKDVFSCNLYSFRLYDAKKLN